MASSPPLNEQARDKRDQEDEDGHLDGVDQGRAHDGPQAVAVVVVAVGVLVGAAGDVIVLARVRGLGLGLGLGRAVLVLDVLAVAVRALAQLVDVGTAVTRAVKHAQGHVHQQADNDAHDDLERQDAKEPGRRLLVRNKDRNHLVRGGENHGDQGAGGDDAAGIQRGRHGREAALGQGAQDGAHHGAGLAGLLHGGTDVVACGVLQGLHGKVGQKQERDELERVNDAFCQYVYEKIHR